MKIQIITIDEAGEQTVLASAEQQRGEPVLLRPHPAALAQLLPALSECVALLCALMICEWMPICGGDSAVAKMRDAYRRTRGQLADDPAPTGEG